MKIILLDDVPKLGSRGEIRDVSDGYARNYLLPHKLALNATSANLKNLDAIKARQESQAAKHGVEVERRRIMLDEPIKTLGEFSVPVRLHSDVTAQLKVSVSRE